MFPYQTDIVYGDDPQVAQNRMRVLVVGSSKVGKTSLIRRLVENVFLEGSEKPDKFDKSRLTAMARAIDGHLYKLEFQEADSSIFSSNVTPNADDPVQPVLHETVSWLDTHTVLFVYDITSEDSYEELARELNILQKRASPDCNICLVGTKADRKRDRQVAFSKAEQDAELRDMSLTEVSSKNGANINLLFDEIVEYIIERREAQYELRRTQEMGYLSDNDEVYRDSIQPAEVEPVRSNLFCFWPFSRS